MEESNSTKQLFNISENLPEGIIAEVQFPQRINKIVYRVHKNKEAAIYHHVSDDGILTVSLDLKYLFIKKDILFIGKTFKKPKIGVSDEYPDSSNS